MAIQDARAAAAIDIATGTDMHAADEPGRDLGEISLITTGRLQVPKIPCLLFGDGPLREALTVCATSRTSGVLGPGPRPAAIPAHRGRRA
jgi:hypothetical protein